MNKQWVVLLIFIGCFVWIKSRRTNEAPRPSLDVKGSFEPEASDLSLQRRIETPAISVNGKRVAVSQKVVESTFNSPVENQTEEEGSGNARVDSEYSTETVGFTVEDGFGVAFGDVLLGEVKSGVTVTTGQSGVPRSLKWDSRRIPYIISPNFPNPERVQRAITYLNQNTAVELVPFQGETDALVFEVGQGCKSYVGRIGGHQPIRLSSGCQTQEILHEILHALGCVHEQTRRDRDQFVKINWDNVDTNYKINFDMVPEIYMSLLPPSDFDYHSIMIYKPDTFARSKGLVTLESIGPEPISPVDEGLSRSDILRINRAFQ